MNDIQVVIDVDVRPILRRDIEAQLPTHELGNVAILKHVECRIGSNNTLAGQGGHEVVLIERIEHQAARILRDTQGRPDNIDVLEKQRNVVVVPFDCMNGSKAGLDSVALSSAGSGDPLALVVEDFRRVILDPTAAHVAIDSAEDVVAVDVRVKHGLLPQGLRLV